MDLYSRLPAGEESPRTVDWSSDYLAFQTVGQSRGSGNVLVLQAAGEPADVADLGVAATQLFGTALSSPAAAVEVWDEEADELVSSPNPSRGRGSRGRGGRGRGRGRGRARGQSDGNDPTPREGDETAIASNNAQGSQEQGSVRLNWRKKKAPVKSMPAEVSDLPASPKASTLPGSVLYLLQHAHLHNMPKAYRSKACKRCLSLVMPY